MNMQNWVTQMISARCKKAAPLVSFPATQLLYVTVKEFVCDPNCMALGMRLIADKYDMPFALTNMDLSVEAEALGGNCVYHSDAVPTILGESIQDEDDANNLVVPEIGAGRTGVNVETVKKALKLISDRPVFANCSGPFSCAGRLMGVNDILYLCVDEDSEEMVRTVLDKVTEFILKYVKALKDAGANGVIMAEPLAGLLSPGLMEEFSTKYVKRIVDEVQDRNFVVCYHNCADNLNNRLEPVIATGCKMFHFGNGADMKDVMEKMPKDVICMGNISPSHIFLNGTTREVRLKTQGLMIDCMNYDNFVPSSGCDVPADTDFDNIDKFFEVVEQGYYKRMLWEIID